MKQISINQNESENTVCSSRIAKLFYDLGSRGDELVMDTIMIGIQLGRNKAKGEDIFDQIYQMVQGLKNIQILQHSERAYYFQKKDLYDVFLNNSASSLIQLIENKSKKMIPQDQSSQNISKKIQNTDKKNQALDKQIEEINNHQDKPQAKIQELDLNQFNKSFEEAVLMILQDTQTQKFLEQQKIMDQQELIEKEFKSIQLAKQIQQQFEEDQSIELARKIQKQDEDEAKSIELLQRIQQDDQIQQSLIRRGKDEIQNKKKDCIICLEEMDFDVMWPLNCSHIYHRGCLNQYFSNKIKERSFPLRCPEQQCKQQVLYQDLTETLNDDDLNSFGQYTLKQYIDSNSVEMSWCPTPDCDYAFAFQNGDSQLDCPKCKKDYCLQCKVDFHKNQSCAEYRQNIVNQKNQAVEQVFLNYVQGSKFKQCPSCKIWVDKSEGCDHMTCRCAYEFCYICGGQYGRCQCRR